MIYKMYSVKDDLTGFLGVSLDQSDETAIRAFKHAVANPDSLMFSNPTDYRLYQVGAFDSETGCVTSIDPKLVVQASSFGGEDNV